jgi:hypothetical protein
MIFPSSLSTSNSGSSSSLPALATLAMGQSCVVGGHHWLTSPQARCQNLMNEHNIQKPHYAAVVAPPYSPSLDHVALGGHSWKYYTGIDAVAYLLLTSGCFHNFSSTCCNVTINGCNGLGNSCGWGSDDSPVGHGPRWRIEWPYHVTSV